MNDQSESPSEDLDAELDEAIEETFPASDPISLSPAKSRAELPVIAAEEAEAEDQKLMDDDTGSL
jgi:hypothetical protein